MGAAFTQFLLKPWMPGFLSLAVVFINFTVYAHLLTNGNPTGLDDVILGRIMGTLDTAFGVVLAYWLGTSKSSHDKDVTISRISGKREVWTDEQRKAR